MVMPPIRSNRTRCIRCSAAASATASGSLDEGGRLTQDSHDVLAPGDVYTLHVAAHDFATHDAFGSAMIAITDEGYNLIHRSPK